MGKQVYRSFKEIDLQLEIYKTEAQIEKAKITNQYILAKEQLGLYSFLGGAVSFIAKRAILLKIIRKFFKK